MENRQPVSLEEQIKQKDAEILALKKKLEDRNPAFNGNLLKRCDESFSEISLRIGQAIYNCLGNDLAGVFRGRRMNFYSSPQGYGVLAHNVSFTKEDEKKIKDDLAYIEMKKFQESLDNFAWAVQNQGGQ